VLSCRRKVLGAVFLVGGLGALIAGFQIVSLASAGIGLMLLVSAPRLSNRAVGGSSESTWLTADSSGTNDGDDNHACCAADTGSSAIAEMVAQAVVIEPQAVS
jgi:hypothetical protein